MIDKHQQAGHEAVDRGANLLGTAANGEMAIVPGGEGAGALEEAGALGAAERGAGEAGAEGSLHSGPILQSGGHTLTNSTKKTLGELFETDPNNIKCALEALKKDLGVPNNVHLKIGANGNVVNDAGRVVGNIGHYTP